MSVFLCPTFGVGYQAFDTNGKPLNSGILWTYGAGTTTPLTTYTTNAGTVSNADPIQLGVDGRPPQEIWLLGGRAYRFDLLDSVSNLIKTYDNIAGVNDFSGVAEWIDTGLTPVFINATSFSFAGNQTTLLPTNIRIKTINTGGTYYGNVISATYSAIPDTTTFVIVNDNASVLDAGLSNVSYAFVSPVNPSIGPDEVNRKGAAISAAGVTNIWNVVGDYITISGVSTTTVTSFGTSFFTGNERTCIAQGGWTIQHSTAISCVGVSNIVTQSGDKFIVRAETVSSVTMIDYTRTSGCPVSMNPIISSLSTDVPMNSTTQYFTGPSVTQGNSGTWFVCGKVSITDTAGGANFQARLWDGTTTNIVDSAQASVPAAANYTTITLSGIIASPQGNIRISVKDGTSASGKIVCNDSANTVSKDSTITVLRIA